MDGAERCGVSCKAVLYGSGPEARIVKVYKCTYTLLMVDWDPEKAAENLAKHKVSFADAVAVLEDEMALTIKDDVDGEERFVTMGMDAMGRVLVVIYTWRDEEIRIISARRANRRERTHYESSR